MKTSLVALKLVLEELGVPAEIATLDDRKKVQKAVYLGQITGVELGYRFSWYILGPYSSELARDYYALAASLEIGEDVPDAKLREETKQRLARVLPLMTMPAGVDLEQEDWLELLASLHYLRTVSHLSFDGSQAAMSVTPKRRLLPYAATAEQLLRETGLLA